MKTLAFFRSSWPYLAIVSVLACASVQASEHGEEGMSHHGGEHGLPKHVVGLFLGATNPEEGDTEYTIGAEYEFRINKYIGVGGIVETTPNADNHESNASKVFIGAVHVHPIGGLRLTFGGGMESVKDEEDEGLWRVGAAYDFEIGNGYAIAPSAAVDWINGDPNYVYGATFSRHFE